MCDEIRKHRIHSFRLAIDSEIKITTSTRDSSVNNNDDVDEKGLMNFELAR